MSRQDSRINELAQRLKSLGISAQRDVAGTLQGKDFSVEIPLLDTPTPITHGHFRFIGTGPN